MRYAAVLTINGRPARRVVELWVEQVPDDVPAPDVARALEGSPHAGRLSTAGIFLANRKVTAEARLAKGWSEAPDAPSVPWGELVKDPSQQMNLRVPRSSLARWKATAAREGVDFSTWVRRSLDSAAGR